MVVFPFKALAMAAIALPSIALAAPTPPPKQEIDWTSPAYPAVDCLLDASVSHDDRIIGTGDSIQDPVRKEDVEKVTKSAKFLEEETKKEWDMENAKRLPQKGLLLRPTIEETNDKQNTKRNYENPLPDEGTWNEKAHAMIHQEAIEVNEKKTATNEPRYVRKEEVEKRPTPHCPHNKHG
ncbi:hypothetical protein ACHAPU_010648 [Fusarium lateritium]